MSRAIRVLDSGRRAMMLHGEEGWDEATACCRFVCQTTYSETTVRSSDEFGLRACTESDLKGGDPKENAAIALSILSGERGPRRDTVVLNALLGYTVYFPSATVREARQAVEQSIDSGAALRVVKKYGARFPLSESAL